jgi:hypothetical protein
VVEGSGSAGGGAEARGDGCSGGGTSGGCRRGLEGCRLLGTMKRGKGERLMKRGVGSLCWCSEGRFGLGDRRKERRG